MLSHLLVHEITLFDILPVATRLRCYVLFFDIMVVVTRVIHDVGLLGILIYCLLIPGARIYHDVTLFDTLMLAARVPLDSIFLRSNL